MSYSRLPLDDDVPSIGALQRQEKWCWIVCNGCQHRVATALASFVIRWGADASSNLLRRNFRCTRCGAKSTATIVRHWVDINVQVEQFPADRAMRYVPPESAARNALPTL